MNKYQEALNTLKASDIKLYVYEDQKNVIEEHQPTIFDFYHSEIFTLQELVNKCCQLEKALDKMCRIFDEEIHNCDFLLIRNCLCDSKCTLCDQEKRVELMKEWVMKDKKL